jgi:very-short-patch-repair endonuclease
MSGLADLITRRGGFATTRQLKSLGASEKMLTGAVRTGLIRRVRNGIYTTRPPHDPEFRALRAGGRLTGLSAIARMGGWVWIAPSHLQVAVPNNAARVPASARVGTDIHWEGAAAFVDATTTSVSVAQALFRVVLDEPLDVSVACIDWALHSGRIGWFELESLILQLPRGAQSIRHWVDGRSQSVLESVARVRIRALGWSCEPQVRLGDFEAIDLVVENHVAVELDGREFHQDAFEADRVRDLRVTIEGRHCIRVTKSMLEKHWPLVAEAIAAALRARRPAAGGNSGQLPRTPHRTPHASNRRPTSAPHLS